MPEPEAAAAPPRRDELEPPGVSTGRVLMAVGAVVAMMLAAIAGLSTYYAARFGGSVRPGVRPLPEPQLETSIAPRANAVRDHGPGPLRPFPVPARAGERAPASVTLERAMAMEAARGSAAYDPVGGASSAPQPPPSPTPRAPR